MRITLVARTQRSFEPETGGVCGIELVAKLDHILRPMFRLHFQRPIDGAQKIHAVLAFEHFFHRRLRIGFDEAKRRFNRFLAGKQPEQCRAEGINIGPRPLTLNAAILLDRPITGREDAGLIQLRMRRLARGTEIKQHEAAIFVAHIDIVGLDVAMQESAFMHH